MLLIRLRPASSTHEALTLALEIQIESAIYGGCAVVLDPNALRPKLLAENNEYGRNLGTILAQTPCMASALDLATGSGCTRIQLMLEGEGPHHEIRWERLEFPNRPPIAIDMATPFSRFAALNRKLVEPEPDAQFRLLFAIASPDDLPAIDSDAQCRSIVKACEQSLDSGQMRLSVMPGHRGLSPDTRAWLDQRRVPILPGDTTAQNIVPQLREADGVHFIAHGSFNKGTFFLMLEDKPALDTDMIEHLRSAAPRLVLLESCQGAVNGDSGLAGFLSKLVQAGIPAAIGMQDFVRMGDAELFRTGFYRSLVLDGVVDVAANEGRRLLADTADYSWAVPIVATRLRGGMLWRETKEISARQVGSSGEVDPRSGRRNLLEGISYRRVFRERLLDGISDSQRSLLGCCLVL